MKKEETNDIVQYLLPSLNKLKIKLEQLKVDVSTEKTGAKRGDIWISSNLLTDKGFEEGIVALIEAKHRNCEIGDADWRDAMRHGRLKADAHSLNYYIVTNCVQNVRFYNAHDDDELILDGKIVTNLQSLEILKKIQTQVFLENSNVFHRARKQEVSFSETKFRKSLKKLADIYRSCGLKKGDERIDPTISFVVLKYIGEKEEESRTLSPTIKLWPDYGKDKKDFVGDFTIAVKHIFNSDSSTTYRDFKDIVSLSSKLKDEHIVLIYKELDKYHFHGSNFDVFGAIYEEFASQSKKREFGEFYTRRHITRVIANLLLREEISGNNIKIADPACGTGGFLTEAFKALMNNYSINRKFNSSVEKRLNLDTFYGYDNDTKSVARTKLNMFLVGDGHTNIHDIDDSLLDWKPKIGWAEDTFDYVLANPPMGKYSGAAKIEDFSFTNEKRNELLFVEKMIMSTKPGGELAFVINDGALEAPSRENFRKHLLEHCNIKAIISLTKFAFAPYTKEKTYVVFAQKKQKEELGNIQENPIWHYIIDYDGYANSDKRFRTIYHDDLGELEDKFSDAVDLAQIYVSNRAKFLREKSNFERKVNSREKKEGLDGMKCGFVEINKIGETNFNNLLSEFYLRPIKVEQISESGFNKAYKGILLELEKIKSDLST